MNIFYLNEDPVVAAQEQCDKHVVKMIVESAQMLSTAHRVIDGKLVIKQNKQGRKLKYWDLFEGSDDLEMEMLIYKPAHVNHPSSIWVRESSSNYQWLYDHFVALCDEYTYRYGKVHMTDVKLRQALRSHPRNIEKGPITLMPLAMKSNPECMFPNDPVKSYQLFYQTKQDRFDMKWSKRNVPEWFEVKNQRPNESNSISNGIQ